MARGAKKEKALTPEEKLAQALVPEAEQPYRVPENWRWTYISAGFNVTSSKRVHKNDWLSEGIPFYRTRELVKLSENGYVDNELFISQDLYDQFKKEYGVPNAGDLLISGVGTIGVPYIVGNDSPFYFKDGNVIWFQNKGLFLPQYIFYLYKSPFICNQIHDMSAGTTVDTYTIVNATKTVLPLPPLPEQQRIVDRIESLFAKLDEAKEKAQVVVDGLGEIHESYLYQAFTGELTANWRRANSNNSAIWENRTLQSVCSMKITDGTHQTPTYCEKDEGIPFISAKDVTSGEICWDNIKYIVPELHDELYARLAPRLDDVLLAKNGTTGVAAIVDVDKVFDLYVTLAVLRPDKAIINPRYLLNVVNSPICKRQFNEHLTGIGVPNLHLRDIKAVTVPLPSLDEQAEIVRVLDKVTVKWQKAKSAAEQVIDQIDTMKRAILARAFRGELGTNDPSEESAEGMLLDLN